MTSTALPLDVLHADFGDALQEHVGLAPYTSARIGGAADVLVTVKSADELAEAVTRLRAHALEFVVLGGGSNVLVSDRGVREVVILNRAKAVKFIAGDQPRVRAEAGATFSQLAHRCAAKAYSGIEWAAAVPGTVGGAVYGNAGAFGGDVMQSLLSAELLSEHGREAWPVEKFGFGYRTSVLKRGELKAVVLTAEFSLENATKEAVSVKIAQFSAERKSAQPPGASMGSMFKNPPGDHAGRLIEAAGLKGSRIGNAEISTLHGNFFINHGDTRAKDIRALIELARKTVKEKSGVELELEIEFIGEWTV
ncbi:MAG TPA: UDP-N-acetylmuramate dehydrogenase [Anaerolineales bacterium]